MNADVMTHPAVVEATAELRPIRERRAALEAERALAHRIGGYRNTFTNEPRIETSEEELVLARLRLGEVDADLRRLRIAEIPAEKKFARAVESARQELIQQVLDEQKADVREMSRVFEKLESLNRRVRERDERLGALYGAVFAPRFSWFELEPETPTMPSRLAQWRKSAREHGLL